MTNLKIKYRLLSPLSHIGETASTGAYFQTLLTSSGRVPCVTANSIRGQLRDHVALHLLERLSTGRLTPAAVPKEAFHVLFSGGNLAGTMKDDVGKAKAVREHFPAVSLLGGGLGDQIMAGKLLLSFAYPVCTETEQLTGEQGFGKSWHELIDEIEFTRTDDGKKDSLSEYIEDAEAEKNSKASTQMRYSVQYLAAGTELVQQFFLLNNTTDLERGALFAGLRHWFETPRLGGMASKGFGFFEAESEHVRTEGVGTARLSAHAQALVDEYERFIDREGMEHIHLLGGGKSGKKTDNAD